jgi:hypothetical protein
VGVLRKLSEADAWVQARRGDRYNAPMPAWVRYAWVANLPMLAALLLLTVTAWWVVLAVPLGIAWVFFGVSVFRWQRRHQTRRWR